MGYVMGEGVKTGYQKIISFQFLPLLFLIGLFPEKL
jgi:hypothetical protein